MLFIFVKWKKCMFFKKSERGLHTYCCQVYTQSFAAISVPSLFGYFSSNFAHQEADFFFSSFMFAE